jgi:hypothetical protein
MSDEVTIGEGPAFDRELPKQGSCSARVWKSFNVGLQPQKVGNPSPKVLIYFILPYRYTTGDYKGKRMLIRQQYTAGFGKVGGKSYLRRDVQAILNREITDEQVKAGFKMNREIAGAPCLIQIVHENGYANVKTIMSMPEGMPALEPDAQADPSPDYVPDYVTKLREKAIIQEKPDTEHVGERGYQPGTPAPQRAPTKEEQDIF